MRPSTPQTEEATQTAEYWDLVHGKGRVAYFLSTRTLQKILRPILKQTVQDAAAQVLLEDAHAAALAPVASHDAMPQTQGRCIARPLAPLSHTLLELMCGSRPTHVGLLFPSLYWMASAIGFSTSSGCVVSCCLCRYGCYMTGPWLRMWGSTPPSGHYSWPARHAASRVLPLPVLHQ